MKFSITFLGGAQTVTGSKFLVEAGGYRVLVDCGLFQGIKDLRLKNWAPFPVDPKSIQAVIITHAHLDHVGHIPLLVRDGFRGKIFVTAPTRALSQIILLDAGHIQEEDALRALKGGYSRHSVPKPLFRVEDVRVAMSQFQSIVPTRWLQLNDDLRFRFVPSGHILGSAFVELEFKGETILFTGDMGREKPLLLHPPREVKHADYLVMESTYGDRRHPREPVLRALSRTISETIHRGGDVLIPSFAVGRSQDILHLLAQLKRQKQLPEVPIYFDSPMGVEATRIFSEFPDWHRLNPAELRELNQLAIQVADAKHSQSIARQRKPKIVLAGSGMMTGGRILNYLARALPDVKSTIVLVGYQAAGTRGRLLRDRVPEIKVYGEFIPVKANVVEIPGLSAHADQAEMMAWLRQFTRAPRRVFLVHGEAQPADVMRLKIEDALGWNCYIPQPAECVRLVERPLRKLGLRPRKRHKLRRAA